MLNVLKPRWKTDKILTHASETASRCKEMIGNLYDNLAESRNDWIEKNKYYYHEDWTYMSFLIPAGRTIIELGCGTGELLSHLRPSWGVGIDLSPKTIEQARRKYPYLDFKLGDVEDRDIIENVGAQFDAIVISDTVGMLEDCEETFRSLHGLCHEDTRIVISYYSRMWSPILSILEKLGLKMPSPQNNWLSAEDIAELLKLAGFDIVKKEWRILLPKRLCGLGRLINKYLPSVPGIRNFSLRNYVVARPMVNAPKEKLSASVIIPARNERGNIRNALIRLPNFCDDLEIIFVEGHSSDNTLEEICTVIAENPSKDIKVLVQDGKGKGDAVRKGFKHARGDVLFILDADLTTPPESMPKFYRAICSGQGEFINGTRLVYPMEDEAMRFLNLVANHVFSVIFSWLLNQRITDTLCGTKVLLRRHYEEIARNRDYFGDFDPFGDFDLLFGASKQNLKFVEIPVRYESRRYGETQISRFQNGLSLLQMVVFAFRRLKAI